MNNTQIFMAIVSLLVIYNLWNLIDKSNKKKLTVDSFKVSLQIADLADKYFEGGFNLYLVSPPLEIDNLISYMFDTGQTVEAIFNLRERMITLEEFQGYLKKSRLTSKSTNIYNAKRVEVSAKLSDETIFRGFKDLCEEQDHSLYDNPNIYLDNIKLTTK